MRFLLRALAFCGFFFGSLPLSSAEIRYFLVVAPDSFESITQRIRAIGGRVPQRIPPSVLHITVPAEIPVASYPGVQHVYRRAVPINEVEPLGLTAVASALHWNQMLTTESGASSIGGLSAQSLRAAAANASLTPPEAVTVAIEASALWVRWDKTWGALRYDIQLSPASDFSTLLFYTANDQAETRLPRPVSAAAQRYFLRVRGVMRNEEGAEIAGPWSSLVSVESPAHQPAFTSNDPVVTSPAQGYSSEGFNVSLEWVAEPSVSYRLQCARTPDFKEPLVDMIVNGGEYKVPSALFRVGDDIHWRVQRWDRETSGWSRPRHLFMGEPKQSQHDMFINPQAPR